MTHKELVQRAGQWLRAKKHVAVLTEIACTEEIPDAIGWKYWWTSTLIECKASRSDFLKDRKKKCRGCADESGLGQYRWYMTPKGLLQPEEVPEKWGLLEVCGRVVRIIKQALPHERQILACRNEMAILVSALRRAEIRIEGTLDDWLK